MFCKNCGASIRDGERFCKQCGTPVSNSASSDTEDLTGLNANMTFTPEPPYTGTTQAQKDYTAERVVAPLPDPNESYNQTYAPNYAAQPATGGAAVRYNPRSVMPILIGVLVAAVVALGVMIYFIAQNDTSAAQQTTLFSSSGTSKSSGSISSSSGSSSSGKSSGSSSGANLFGSSSSGSSRSSSGSGSSSSGSSSSSSSGSSSSSSSSGITQGTHTYKFIAGDVTFAEAAQQARAMGGYLAVIDSRDEFNTIIAQARAQRNNGSSVLQYYIGAKRPTSSTTYYFTDRSGNVTNRTVNSVFGSWFWGSGEPSYSDANTGDNETILSIMYLESSDSWVGNDVVDDIAAHYSEFSGKVGYIVEIE